MADATVSKTVGEIRTGSSPVSPTNFCRRRFVADSIWEAWLSGLRHLVGNETCGLFASSVRIGSLPPFWWVGRAGFNAPVLKTGVAIKSYREFESRTHRHCLPESSNGQDFAFSTRRREFDSLLGRHFPWSAWCSGSTLACDAGRASSNLVALQVSCPCPCSSMVRAEDS